MGGVLPSLSTGLVFGSGAQMPDKTSQNGRRKHPEHLVGLVPSASQSQRQNDGYKQEHQQPCGATKQGENETAIELISDFSTLGGCRRWQEPQ